MMGGTDGAGDAIPNPTPENISRFLARHGETPVNLVAAFEKTRDRRLLERALELFPNNPVVLMAAIDAVPHQEAKVGEKYGPDAERVALIERFKAADPNNPLPWIYSAQELFKSGQNAEAIAEIRAALDRPAFYTYSTERMDAAQRLYEDLGLHPVEAGLLAMAGLTLPHMSAATQTSRMLMEWQKKAADSGDAAAADEALRLTYNLGRTFATPEASRTLIGQLVAISMERRALEALPADSQPGWLTITPAQRLAELNGQTQSAKEIASGLERVFKSQNEEVLSEYLRRMRTESEAAAFAWLKKQTAE
jgi:tetratricopeptide (TPR) repeat protein